VIVADQLPRTSTGKIQKNVIRKNLSGYYTGEFSGYYTGETV
jgi:acyl-coenzyme A synthetase/AMP-(fatty) acid ligase